MKNKLNMMRILIALELSVLILMTACSPKADVNPPAPSSISSAT